MGAGGLDRRAVCDRVDGGKGRDLAVFKALCQAGCALWLDADYLNLGIEHLCEGGHAGRKTAAAHGDEDHVDEGQLLVDLHGDRALAGRNAGIIEGVDEGIAVLPGKLERLVAGLVIDITVEHHFGAEGLRAVHLDERCRGRHDDDGLYAVGLCRIGNALRVVAGRCGDETLLPLLIGERRDLVVGAAHLVGAGALHVFGL